jgi:hypothetical protein
MFPSIYQTCVAGAARPTKLRHCSTICSFAEPCTVLFPRPVATDLWFSFDLDGFREIPLSVNIEEHLADFFGQGNAFFVGYPFQLG